MELKTTVFKVGDSVCVRIPPAMVEFFGLANGNLPQEAKIKEAGTNSVEVFFIK